MLAKDLNSSYEHENYYFEKLVAEIFYWLSNLSLISLSFPFYDFNHSGFSGLNMRNVRKT